MLEKIIHILRRPRFIIGVLSYYVTILGLKIVFNLNFLNIFTAFLMPVTFIAIYFIWNLFYYENLGDDNNLRDKYFDKISEVDKKNIENLMNIREDIQKIFTKTDINSTKQGLVSDLGGIDINTIIEKYANNCIKIKFIDDFLKKKNMASTKIKDKFDKLISAKEKFRKLNDDIVIALENIQAQGVFILADDASSDSDTKDSINDIRKKIEIIDSTNDEINKFYVSINDRRGENE